MSSSSSSDVEQNPVPRRPIFKLRQRRRRAFHNVMRLIREYISDADTFREKFGINKYEFKTLHNMVSGQLSKTHNKFWNMKPLHARDQLALCLRFLRSGRPIGVLSEMYHLRVGIVETIIREVCNAILVYMRPFVMPYPTEVMWKQVRDEYKSAHDMPNCLGSLSGQYINIRNRKLYMLLALVDANHRFLMIDIGDYDVNSRFVWDNSVMARRFNRNDISVPVLEPTDSDGGDSDDDDGTKRLPHVVVAGSCFPSTPYMITKFKDSDCAGNDVNKVYNFRINAVKQTADEALTRLRRRWRVIQECFYVPPAIAERIILTTCCLQNYFDASTS